MKLDINYSQALWFAWGNSNAGVKLTGTPEFDGGDPAFGFAKVWSTVVADYGAERRGFRPSVQDAFAAWQAGEKI